MALEKSAEKPALEQAPEVELGLTLAEITGAGRSAEGKAALEKLAAAHPKDLEVAEALGYEAWRGGQFERAVELGSGNAKLHYQCAGLSQEQGRPPARVAELLEKATALEPEYRDAWLRQGYAPSLSSGTPTRRSPGIISLASRRTKPRSSSGRCPALTTGSGRKTRRAAELSVPCGRSRPSRS